MYATSLHRTALSNRKTLPSECQISREVNKWYKNLFSFCQHDMWELGRTDKKKHTTIECFSMLVHPLSFARLLQ